MIKVGITGGIGSGKSTVCRLFAACGAPVYDSDTQAKRLMEEDGPLRRRLAARFGEEIYAGGRLNRKLLAGRVFSDPAELSALNALVHPAVMEDFERWCGRQSGADYVVLESAILFEAGLEG
ncbi:dephospho-CoA kinase, partial [Alistipes putredinis]